MSICTPRGSSQSAMFGCHAGSSKGLPFTHENLPFMSITRLLERKITGGYTALHYACQNGYPQSVCDLLEAVADPNITKNNGATPLISACAAAGFESEDSLCLYIACVEQLLSSPRFSLALNDYCSNDESHISPVCICVNKQYREEDALLPLLEILLSKGFDPNGAIRATPALHYALYHNHRKCALALVRAGADLGALDRKDPDDVTAGRWTAKKAAKKLCSSGFARRLEQEAAKRVNQDRNTADASDDASDRAH